jgi:hypothetical protein
MIFIGENKISRSTETLKIGLTINKERISSEIIHKNLHGEKMNKKTRREDFATNIQAHTAFNETLRAVVTREGRRESILKF